MRNYVTRPAVKSSVRIIAAFTAALFLTGCSGSFDRLVSWRGKNPSDADPVYTAALPKKKATSVAAATGDDTISTRPIFASRTKQKSYSYAARKPAKLQLDNDVQREEPVETAINDTQDEAAPSSKAVGGKIRVERGMTLYSIANANGLTIRQVARANNLRAPYRIKTGQLIRLPGIDNVQVPNNTLASQQRQIENDSGEAPSVDVARKVNTGKHQVAAGDTFYALSRAYGVSPEAIAKANGMRLKSKLSVGETLNIPGGEATVADNSSNPQNDAGSQISVAENTSPVEVDTAPAKVSEVPEIPSAGQGLNAKQVVETQQPVAEVPAVADGMSLRWPLRGKIISEFGKKPDGAKNEGINISVPEGTSVRAAETGVVAYAGNELKGYGNLVLVRHEGGYVTAYAHAKKLLVKKGDAVRRGDVIAEAGKTGAVTSPQLHFEVRKGATALDPLKFLGNAQAAN